MKKNNELNKIINLIEKHDKIALFHHIMIDGDSFSSSYGLLKAIKAKFPNKEVRWVADIESAKKRFWYIDIDESTVIDKIDDSWLAIIGDCAGKERIEKFEEYEKAGSKIAYDHHTNDIDFDVDVFWHEPKWIASSLQAALIAEELKTPFTEEIALMLVFGIITDSGRFSYSGADPLPLEVASRLYKFISNESLNRIYYNMSKKTMKGLKFESWVYANFKLEDKLSYLKITADDLNKLKMSPSSATRVNMLANIEDSKVWIMFIQYPEFIRVEFRSNGLAVNEVAKHFGGGGHIKASGCRLKNMSEADEVIKYTKQKIRDFKK